MSTRSKSLGKIWFYETWKFLLCEMPGTQLHSNQILRKYSRTPRGMLPSIQYGVSMPLCLYWPLNMKPYVLRRRPQILLIHFWPRAPIMCRVTLIEWVNAIHSTKLHSSSLLHKFSRHILNFCHTNLHVQCSLWTCQRSAFSSIFFNA